MALSRMLLSPIPGATSRPKPRPSSETSAPNPSPSTLGVTRTLRASECRRALVSASCRMPKCSVPVFPSYSEGNPSFTSSSICRPRAISRFLSTRDSTSLGNGWSSSSARRRSWTAAHAGGALGSDGRSAFVPHAPRRCGVVCSLRLRTRRSIFVNIAVGTSVNGRVQVARTCTLPDTRKRVQSRKCRSQGLRMYSRGMSL
jgi:hypothetical protein